MPETKRPLKVFLCHAHPDRDAVHSLYIRLTKDGVDAWLDKEKLIGGQDWEYEIRKAVRESDVVVVCLSKKFAQKGFRQYEVRIALEEANLQPEGEIFIIPLRLEDCNVPQSLRRWHWVDLFEEDGYERLMRSLRARADNIGATLQVKKSWLPKITSPRSIQQKPVETKKPEILKKKDIEEKSEIPVDNGLPRIDEPLPPAENFPESWESEWQPSFEPDTTREESIPSAKSDLVLSTSAQETGGERAEKAERDHAKKSVKYPSARIKGMQEFMGFTREPDWKPPLIDIPLLKRLGIAEGKESLVIQALLFLGVINDAGIITNEFDNLKKDYQVTLKRLVQEKYGDLLSSIPLRKANQLQLVRYFGDPSEIAEYQAKLFIWFCEQSGIAVPKSNVEERLALEKLAREKQERETTKKSMREKAKREAAEKAKWERAERRAAQIAALKETCSKAFNTFRLAIANAMPILRITGIIGIILVLIWVGSWAMPQILSLMPTATAGLTPTSSSLPTEITDSKGVQMVLVSAGEFTMGGGSAFSNENPAHVVYLDSFYIDKYEVTNALYRVCDDEIDGCERPDYTNLYYISTRENHPVVAVDWNMANVYCKWRGARLPTEAEWEKAARGEDKRLYPWTGTTLSPTYANYNSEGTKPVGSYLFVRSPYEAYDMTGNVSEWVSDWYSPDYYQTVVGQNNSNPTGPPDSPFSSSHNFYGRVFRGGSWKTKNSNQLSTTYRSSADPDSYADDLGFRCARDVNP